MKISFDLATPADDEGIRRLLTNNPMPGTVTVTYEREPNYFLGCDVIGPQCQTLVARTETDEIAGIAVRGSRPRLVNGEVMEIGYLGGLRVDRSYKGNWIVPPGFRKMHELHEEDGRVAAYLVTITNENAVARNLLVNRAWRSFPMLRPIDQLMTLAIILQTRWRWRARPARGITIERGMCANVREVVTFLQEQGSRRQFFPTWIEDDFTPESATTRGFRIEDLIIARRNGRIVGTIGLWDQSGYKQTIVHGYARLLARTRPAYDLGARILGASPLPRPGTALHYAVAAFVCVADDDPHVFRTLLRELVGLASARGYAYLMVGLSRRDPLLAVARRYLHITYRSTLYIATWKDGQGFHERYQDRIPYVEIGTL